MIAPFVEVPSRAYIILCNRSVAGCCSFMEEPLEFSIPEPSDSPAIVRALLDGMSDSERAAIGDRYHWFGIAELREQLSAAQAECERLLKNHADMVTDLISLDDTSAPMHSPETRAAHRLVREYRDKWQAALCRLSDEKQAHEKTQADKLAAQTEAHHRRSSCLTLQAHLELVEADRDSLRTRVTDLERLLAAEKASYAESVNERNRIVNALERELAAVEDRHREAIAAVRRGRELVDEARRKAEQRVGELEKELEKARYGDQQWPSAWAELRRIANVAADWHLPERVRDLVKSEAELAAVRKIIRGALAQVDNGCLTVEQALSDIERGVVRHAPEQKAEATELDNLSADQLRVLLWQANECLRNERNRVTRGPDWMPQKLDEVKAKCSRQRREIRRLNVAILSKSHSASALVDQKRDLQRVLGFTEEALGQATKDRDAALRTVERMRAVVEAAEKARDRRKPDLSWYAPDEHNIGLNYFLHGQRGFVNPALATAQDLELWRAVDAFRAQEKGGG